MIRQYMIILITALVIGCGGTTFAWGADVDSDLTQSGVEYVNEPAKEDQQTEQTEKLKKPFNIEEYMKAQQAATSQTAKSLADHDKNMGTLIVCIIVAIILVAIVFIVVFIKLKAKGVPKK